MNIKITAIVSAVLILALLAATAGCESGGKPSETPAAPGTGNSANAPDNGDASTSAPGTGNSANTPSGAPSSEKPTDSSITEYTLAGYSSYSDGVAWVRGYDEIWYCIDKKGNILFALEAGSRPVSDFTGGIAVVETASEYYSVTTDNKVVASLLKSDYDTIRYVDNKACYVVKVSKTLEGNTEEQGLFDMRNNDWQIPLAQSSPLLPQWYSYHQLFQELLPALYYGNSVYLYKGGALFTVPMKNMNANEFEALNKYIYEEGFSLFIGTPVPKDSMAGGADAPAAGGWYDGEDISDEVERQINAAAFTATKLLNVDYPARVVTLDDNLIFIATYSGSGIYDMSGKLAADLSEYNFQRAAAVDGRLLALLTSPDGVPFTTVFDQTGKMLFGPIECGYQNWGASDGVFYLNDGFYDINGNVVFAVKAKDNFDYNGFRDGVLWVISTQDSGLKQLALVDKKGETLFETGYVN